MDYAVTATFTHPADVGLNNFVVDWGDGDIQTIAATSPTAATDVQEFDHAYAYGPGYGYCVTVNAETEGGPYIANAYVFSDTPYVPSNAISVGVPPPPTGYNFGFAFADGGATGTTAETYTVNWGDTTDGSDNTSESVVPGEGSGIIGHNYLNSGVYTITVTGNDSGHVGSYQTNFAVPMPTITALAEQVVGSGQTVTLADLSGPADNDATASVEWASPADIVQNSDGTETITSNSPGPGAYTPTITLTQSDNGADPGFVEYGGGLITSATATGGAVDVWGVELDNGESNDVLAASSDGTQNLQGLAVSVPRPAGEAVNITLTSTDASQDDVWTTSTPVAGTDTPVLGASASSYTFLLMPGVTTADFWTGATAGSTTAGALSFSITGTTNTANSTSTFLTQLADGGPGVPASGSTPPTTLPASLFGMQFEAPTDSAGNPILVDDGGASGPASGVVAGSSSVFSPPAASLVKVDLVYPSSVPGGAYITLTADTIGLRFWDTQSENRLVLSSFNPSISFLVGSDSPTTLYAEATTPSLISDAPLASFSFTPLAGVVQAAAVTAPGFEGWSNSITGVGNDDKTVTVKGTVFRCEINPVAGGKVIQLGQANAPTPLNFIQNPAAIVVDSNPTPTTCANIVATAGPFPIDPPGSNTQLTASDLYWSFDNSPQFTGKAAFYVSPGKTNLDARTGLSVQINGVTPGPIRLNVNLITANGAVLVETYDAIVVAPKVVYCRAQILASSGTSLQAVENEISVTNIYLRQAGILLKPDPNNNVFKTPGLNIAPQKNAPGVFAISRTDIPKVPTAINDIFNETPTENDVTNGISLLNDDPGNGGPGVVQIIFSSKLAALGERSQGVAPLGAPNSYGAAGAAGVTLSYRPGSKKVYVQNVTMNVKAGIAGSKVWGLYILPGGVSDSTLAHELGHVLGLMHRGAKNTGELLAGNDGLLKQFKTQNYELPTPNYNIMGYDTNAEDFDLPQVIAMQGSSALNNTPGGG